MQGASVADILYQQLSPVDVALPPSIASQPLGSVLRHALSKHPAQRAASADELAAQFRVLNFAALVGPFDAGRAKPHTAATVRAAQRRGCNGGRIPAGHHAVLLRDDRRRRPATPCGNRSRRPARPLRGAVADEVRGYRRRLWRAGRRRLGDTLLFHFGLQGDIDRPARRCGTRHGAGGRARAVAGAGRSRLYRTAAKAGASMAAAIHVGQVLAHAAQWAGGSTPAAASRLLRLPGGQILISDDARSRSNGMSTSGRPGCGWRGRASPAAGA